jgi:hypothetical protein
VAFYVCLSIDKIWARREAKAKKVNRKALENGQMYKKLKTDFRGQKIA